MKRLNKPFSDYTILSATLEDSGLPIQLKVYYTFEPEFPGSIKNGEHLSEPEPAGVSIDEVTVQLSETTEVILSEYIHDYLTNLRYNY